jgi:hypothetical protein
MLRLVAAVVAVTIVLAPRIADACGSWHMKDVDKKLDVRWVVDAAQISNAKATLAALYLDGEDKGDKVRVVANRKVIFDFAGDKLRRYGKPVATFDAASMTIGKKTFTFAFTDPHELHGFTAWKMTVKLGDKLVIESRDATAICAAAARGGMSDEDMQAHIRREVMFYLAWRELGM